MILTDILLGLSLAVDAAAISIALGITHRSALKWQHMVGIALCFGAFQALMPLAGWLGGSTLLASFGSWNAWIASLILCGVGINMLRNARKDDDDASPKSLSVGTILLLAVATSIDALAVGFTLTELSLAPLYSIASIGITTFLLCLLSIRAAHIIPRAYANPAEFAAGCVLIGLGIRTLL